MAQFAREHQLATLASQPAQTGQSRLVLRGAWPEHLPETLLVQTVSLDDLFEVLT